MIQRGQAGAAERDRAETERNTETIVDAMTEARKAITELDKRLGQIESRITG